MSQEMCDYSKWYNGIILSCIGISLLLSIVFIKTGERIALREQHLKDYVNMNLALQKTIISQKPSRYDV